MNFFNRKQFLFFLALYFAVRVFSLSAWMNMNWFFSFNELIILGILFFTAYCLIKKNPLGWYIVAAEIILGGSGAYLAVSDVSLRTLLLIISISIYTLGKIKDLRLKIANVNLHSIFNLQSSIFLLITVATISTFVGFFNNHQPSTIISDLIPYFFLLYYFPLKNLITNEKFKNFCFNLLAAAIIGNFLMTAYAFIGYNLGAFAVHDTFYWWWRQFAGGKVTALPFGYYRIVLNEQLLLIPLLLWSFYNLITCHPDENRDLCHSETKYRGNSIWWILGASLLVILSVNLTRIYLVAGIVGTLILFKKEYWKKWLATAATFAAIFLIGFFAIHLTASRGQSFGFNLLLGRLQSIVAPQTEDSSLSRLILLPKILEKIKSAPILGQGLGDTVTAYSPTFQAEITTPHFDWGYLEIWAEMGLIGLLAWGLFLSGIIKNILKKPLALSALAALIVINITSPALFHVLGIILLIILFSTTTSETKNIYRVPINLNLVTSVSNNSIAHIGDLVNAIDYDAPEGTPIYAALDGVVLNVKDDSNIGGIEKKYENDGNYIEILHANNEISEYEHLRQNSAKIKIGDKINSGDVIAEVGNTGWSECSHLHFMVYPKDQECKTKQIRFK